MRYFLLIITVQGHSMLPTLEPNDRVLLMRHWPARWLQHNQMVVLRLPASAHDKPSPLFIKRLIGLPRETITTRFTELPPAWREKKRHEYDAGEQRVWHIPARHYFVRADGLGVDSLIWGTLPLTSLVGVVIARLPRHLPLPAAPQHE